MLKLPDATLVLIETREHALAKLALEDCEARAELATSWYSPIAQPTSSGTG
jgi:hypothetical protein